MILPPLKQGTAHNDIQKKTTLLSSFLATSAYHKKTDARGLPADYDQLKHKINDLKQEIAHIFNQAPFWQRYWGKTQATYKTIRSFLDTILHEGVNCAYQQRQRDIRQTITELYRSLDSFLLVGHEDSAIEALKPWIFAQAALLYKTHQSILVASGTLAHHLAAHLKIKDHQLVTLFDSNHHTFEGLATKEQRWINLIQSEWPQQEHQFAPTFIHNALVFAWVRLLNPWSSTVNLPTDSAKQYDIFAHTPHVYFSALLFAAHNNSMQYRDSTQKKLALYKGYSENITLLLKSYNNPLEKITPKHKKNMIMLSF